MHPDVFAEFDRICSARAAGGAVLEIGAAARDDTLLCLPALAGAREKIGVDLAGNARHRDFEIVAMNANDLAGFADRRFDTILCNSVLEHDPFFWRTLAAIRRVARAGAVVVIGVPGFGPRPRSRLRLVARRLRRAPVIGRVAAARLDPILASTPALVVHEHPGDYYRFSAAAVSEVLLAGMEAVEVRTILTPPRIIGAGRVPH